MKKIILLLLFTHIIYAQNKVIGTITTKDTASLSILGIYQEQFPNVSVVFRAEKINGNAIFGLGINDMIVNEMVLVILHPDNDTYIMVEVDDMSNYVNKMFENRKQLINVI